MALLGVSTRMWPMPSHAEAWGRRIERMLDGVDPTVVGAKALGLRRTWRQSPSQSLVRLPRSKKRSCRKSYNVCDSHP